MVTALVTTTLVTLRSRLKPLEDELNASDELVELESEKSKKWAMFHKRGLFILRLLLKRWKYADIVIALTDPLKAIMCIFALISSTKRLPKRSKEVPWKQLETCFKLKVKFNFT